MLQVLLVEDDVPISSLLMQVLAERNVAVSTAVTGLDGVAQALAGRPDLVVLDLGLPDIDGLEVLSRIRAASGVPVIVATARDDDATVVRALGAGADDYVVKPFSADQLEARIRAVLRRTGGASAHSSTVTVGALHLDLRSREAQLNGAVLELSPREFELLAYLADRPGQVVTRAELLAEVWRTPPGGPDKTVDVHLSWLRRKLGETAQEPVYLHTVRGVGVKLVAPA